MTRKNRIEYFVCTLGVAVTGFLIYGTLASGEPLIVDGRLLSFLVFGLFGGLGFSAIVSTIILSVLFFRKRGSTFKITAALLWPITFAACVYAGMLSYLPYQIYNLIRIFTQGNEEKQPTDSTTHSIQ